MEDQIGPDRHEKSEFSKLEEEIIDLEFNESILAINNKKSATTISLATNLIALISFILWAFLMKTSSDYKLILVPEVIGLAVSIILFYAFCRYKIEDNHKLKSNFYVTFAQFIVFITITVFM